MEQLLSDESDFDEESSEEIESDEESDGADQVISFRDREIEPDVELGDTDEVSWCCWSWYY